jgi:voltage-gated potassium channel
MSEHDSIEDVRSKAPEPQASPWQAWHDPLMTILSLAWTALFVVELVRGLTPLGWWLGAAVWSAFALEFAIEFVLARDRSAYLRREWLMALALVAPMFRLLRLARLAGLARGIRSLRVVNVFTSIGRGMRTLGHGLGRRGAGYVAGLSVLTLVVGAAGMYAAERGAAGGGFDSYASALWWTAMLLTSMGSDYWPQSAEGRTLCFVLALYGFAMFGYVTAALASLFVGRDADAERRAVAGKASLEGLQADIAALRAEIQYLTSRFERPGLS